MAINPDNIKYVDCGLSGVDSLFYHLETPEALMTIAGLYIFDQSLTLERVSNEFTGMVERFPRFSERLQFNRLNMPVAWETDPEYHIGNHVTEKTLSPPKKGQTFDQQLFNVVAEIQSIPWDFKRPLWAATLIHSADGTQSALYSRLHHVVADGQGCIRMVLTTCKPVNAIKASGESSQYGAMGRAHQKNKKSKGPSFLMKLWLGFLQIFISIWSFLCVLYKLNHISWYRRRGLRGQSSKQKVVAWTEDISLDEVKQVKNHFGVTVNDILVTCLSGAFSDYMAKHEADVHLREFLASIPISVRRLDDWSLGNKVALAYLWLPTYIEDPVERLQVVRSRMESLKKSPEAAVSYAFLNICGRLPIITWPSFLNFMRKFAYKAHTVFTNVPGPRNQLEFAGVPIRSYIAFVPQNGRCGLGTAILTYNGKVSLSVYSDEDVIGKHVNIPEEITNRFVYHFREYQNLVTKKDK